MTVKKWRKTFNGKVSTTYVDRFDIFFDEGSEEMGYWDQMWFGVATHFKIIFFWYMLLCFELLSTCHFLLLENLVIRRYFDLCLKVRLVFLFHLYHNHELRLKYLVKFFLLDVYILKDIFLNLVIVHNVNFNKFSRDTYVFPYWNLITWT